MAKESELLLDENYTINCPTHGPNSSAEIVVRNKRKGTAVLKCDHAVYECPNGNGHKLEGSARAREGDNVFSTLLSNIRFMVYCATCGKNVTPQSSSCGYTDGQEYYFHS